MICPDSRQNPHKENNKAAGQDKQQGVHRKPVYVKACIFKQQLEQEGGCRHTKQGSGCCAYACQKGEIQGQYFNKVFCGKA